MHQFFGCGFSIASRNGDEGDAELIPVISGQCLEGFQNIVYLQEPVVGMLRYFICYSIGCTLADSLQGKMIAIEVFTFEGKEEIAGFQAAAVGADFRMLQINFVE